MAGPDDPFDTLFTLEDQYYEKGFSQGASDGARAGRLEGRLFGYEKAFEKFLRMGKLHGRAIVLNQRMNNSFASSPRTASEEAVGARLSVEAGSAVDAGVRIDYSVASIGTTTVTLVATEAKQSEGQHGQAQYLLPVLPHSQRLFKNIDSLHALTEPLTFSTQNDEDAVADFDDRLRRAEAKAKLIDRAMDSGHGDAATEAQGRMKEGTAKTGAGDMEEFTIGNRKARTAI